VKTRESVAKKVKSEVHDGVKMDYFSSRIEEFWVFPILALKGPPVILLIVYFDGGEF
jgi:hypothetical protein